MKTSTAKLQELKIQKDAAIKEYNAYLKEYNKERKIESGQLVHEIIALHKQGLSNKEIVEQGYNKNYVNQQVTFFRKGKRMVKTQVAGYFPAKLKKK